MLDRIQIRGYRRLLKADAYVGRKTVAFVGPNEAGKSSVLSALRLFDSEDAVPSSDSSRSQRGQQLDANRAVVRLWFTLDDAQMALAESLPIDTNALRHLTFIKRADGRRTYLFDPAPVLLPSVREELHRAWAGLRDALRMVYEATPEGAEVPFDTKDLDALSKFLDGAAGSPHAETWKRLSAGVEELLDDDDKKLATRVSAFNRYLEWAGPGTNLHTLVYRAIGASLPMFVQFTDDLRSIRAEYPIDDDSTDTDAALGNLLRLAGLPLDQIRGALAEPSYLHELEDNANDRLRTFFTENWSQEAITVGLKIGEHHLHVDVKDLAEGGPGWINITERSDGLRAFVALAAFLDSGDFEHPPILLIDEAEQHLHQNAQGDLIRMLQDLKGVSQVLYTTHSPACLPADLGNGVRFVEPVANGHSVIRHDFWSLDRNEHVGFNPLLIVMGAGAAAFSSLRSALVAEGVSDMLLLPTLIRLATGLPELPYQVSPGIATASKADMSKLDFVAGRVAYLVDGDPGGKAWQSQLEGAGVPKARVRSLPEGVGLEDLLDRDFYLDAVADLNGIERELLAKTPTDVPIKSAVEALKLHKKLAGPTAFAEFILGRHESGQAPIALNPNHRRLLQQLNAWALKTIAG